MDGFAFNPGLKKKAAAFFFACLPAFSPATGKWVLKEISVQGQGGFLFIKKGFRSTTRFGDYRRRPQKEEVK